MRSSLGAALLAALVVALTPTLAAATTVTYSLDTEFSGAVDPAGPTPWMTITFDDSFGGTDTVRVTIDNVNITAQEFVSGAYLNFDPSLDASQLTLTAIDTSAVASVGFNAANDAYMADGAGKADIFLDFPPPPGSFAQKFTAGEQIVFDLTYTSAIDANSFDFESAPGGGNGLFGVAAHVQGIAGGGSGWIDNGAPPVVVPEPVLGALLLLGAAGIRRRV